jgi:hypothetical protein
LVIVDSINTFATRLIANAQLAELVDALVSNTCGKPCRFDSGAGYKNEPFERKAFFVTRALGLSSDIHFFELIGSSGILGGESILSIDF